MSIPTTTVSVKCQAQTGSTFMCLRLYMNDFILRSVYSRSLVNLNKACVRVPLVIILPEGCSENAECGVRSAECGVRSLKENLKK